MTRKYTLAEIDALREAVHRSMITAGEPVYHRSETGAILQISTTQIQPSAADVEDRLRTVMMAGLTAEDYSKDNCDDQAKP